MAFNEDLIFKPEIFGKTSADVTGHHENFDHGRV